MKRRARGDRPPVGRFAVTERDREIVHAVGRMGQATTDQLSALFFSERSVASRRLAKLAAMRLIDVHATEPTAPNLYTLGKAGFDLLVSAGADADALHRSRAGRRIDEHLRALNDVRVAFVRGARENCGIELVAFHADLDLRRVAGSTPPAYLPDGLVEFLLPSGPLALVVEIDLGSEAVSVFASKVETTVALWRGSRKCWGAAPGTWRPVVFVLDDDRARVLARSIAAKDGGALWLVADLARVRTSGVVGPAFATAEHVAATPRGSSVTYPGIIVPAAAEVAS